jgi:uncharacterized membrane protein required for colicin V production
MIESLVLDILIVAACLLLVPIGFVRGGVREVCSSAGLLLGILLSNAWAYRWGSWAADRIDTSTRGAIFTTSIVIVIVVTGIVGYGGAGALTWVPGPGGKTFGAVLALLNGIVLSGFVVNGVATIINAGDYPAVVERSIVARSLAVGFDWVLLIAGMVVLALSLLGAIVREREDEDHTWAAQSSSRPPRSSVRQVLPTRPYAPEEPEKIEPSPTTAHPGSDEFVPVTVREVRHWEDESPAPAPGTTGGWRQTWPGNAAGKEPRTPWDPPEQPKRPSRMFGPVPPASQPKNAEETLRDWMADEDDKNRRR